MNMKRWAVRWGFRSGAAACLLLCVGTASAEQPEEMLRATEAVLSTLDLAQTRKGPDQALQARAFISSLKKLEQQMQSAKTSASPELERRIAEASRALTLVGPKLRDLLPAAEALSLALAEHDRGLPSLRQRLATGTKHEAREQHAFHDRRHLDNEARQLATKSLDALLSGVVTLASASRYPDFGSFANYSHSEVSVQVKSSRGGKPQLFLTTRYHYRDVISGESLGSKTRSRRVPTSKLLGLLGERMLESSGLGVSLDQARAALRQARLRRAKGRVLLSRSSIGKK